MILTIGQAAFDIPILDRVQMSYVEILKDEVYDLMSEKQAVGLCLLMNQARRSVS